MADDFYKQMQGVAASVFKQFKQGVMQIVRSTEGPPVDPTKPWEPGPVSKTTITLMGTCTGVKAYQTDGTQVVLSDEVISCAALDSTGTFFEPNENDVLLVDGEQRQIKKIEANPAAGTPVAYKIYIAG